MLFAPGASQEACLSGLPFLPALQRFAVSFLQKRKSIDGKLFKDELQRADSPL
jgi:hypothetical protein